VTKYIIIAVILLTGCSVLTDLATSAIKPGGGMSAEVVVGDKEQGIGANQDLEVEGSVDKVIGGNDASTKVDTAGTLEVNNISVPPYVVITLIIALVIAAGVPSTLYLRWRKILKGKPNEL
jgi:hypothetical protein